MAVNEEYKTNFVVKMDKLRLQRENALNERYPKRKEERHERKKVRTCVYRRVANAVARKTKRNARFGRNLTIDASSSERSSWRDSVSTTTRRN